jgi:hypothetical protein
VGEELATYYVRFFAYVTFVREIKVKSAGESTFKLYFSVLNCGDTGKSGNNRRNKPGFMQARETQKVVKGPSFRRICRLLITFQRNSAMTPNSNPTHGSKTREQREAFAFIAFTRNVELCQIEDLRSFFWVLCILQ